MNTKTPQQQPIMVQSRYATMSVEEQGEVLIEAAYGGNLKRFTPADWAVFIDSGALGWKDNLQMLFLHWAASQGCLDQVPHPVWQALMDQDLLQEKDFRQRLFLHCAAWKGSLDQIPHYVFAHMTPERGYGADFWLSKDMGNDNILDNAAWGDNGEHFPKAMIPALWRGRQAVLRALWAEMKDRLKDEDGVKEAYERFLLHPMLRPQKKMLALK